MDKTILIYVLIVGFAILSSVIRKSKKKTQYPVNKNKPNPTVTTKKPTQSTQTLDDLLQTILGQKTTTQTTPTPKPKPKQKEIAKTKKEPLVHESLYNEESSIDLKDDSELFYKSEFEDYDIITDHHVHGTGFDEPEEMFNYETSVEQNEWSDMDWRKAIIASEILKRPDF